MPIMPADMTLPLIIFALTVVMIMSGRGGGNFYLIALVLSGVPMHTASTTSQFILLASALAGTLVFGKAKTLSWKLVLFFGGLNALAAFIGGFEAQRFSGSVIKTVLALLLLVAGFVMLLPEPVSAKRREPCRGCWQILEGNDCYLINLWMAVPLTLIAGFFSGMVGISGGSFLVPLMVVGCGVPVKVAVGTATAMLAATALAGFIGNALHGGFSPSLALPCGIAAVTGALIGSKMALKSKPGYLKIVSGTITIAAGVMMLLRLNGE